jgi:malonyl-CoA/methylmalonyl-CoA synthetase
MSDSRIDVGAADRAAWERHLGGPVPPRLRADMAAGTIPTAARATADRLGDQIAATVQGQALTHRELVQRMDAVAAWLSTRGVASGHRVLLCAPNSIDLVVAYLGVLAAGATAVLANPAATAAEVAHLVADSGAAVAFTDADRKELVRSASSALDVLTLPAEDINVGPADRGAPLRVAPESVAVLAYTSGTTGIPKGTPLTHANILASTRGALMAWRWRDDDVCLHALPLYHQHGLSAVHAAVVSGSQVQVVGRLDAAALEAPSTTERPTVIFAVPSIYQRLAESGDLELLRMPRLRLAISGSAPLSPDLAEEIAAATGALPLERYGTTESGLNLSNPYAGPRRPGRVGQPLPGVEVRLRDQAGEDVADGDPGEICVRGPQVFSGYETCSATTSDTFWPGSWFRTGDIGVCDPADGSYAIVGRSKELIVTGGLNVYPREVELALSRHPDVADVAVAGVPSERWGEEVTAFVVAATGSEPNVQALMAHCRQVLTSYKCPKRVVVVDFLPRSGTGKVLRSRLVQGVHLGS